MQHVLAVEFAPDMDRKTFPCVFINNAQHAERPAIMGSIHHEVVTPDVVLCCWAMADARTVNEPEPTAFGLLWGNFKPFTPTYALRLMRHPSCSRSQ